MPKKKVDTSLPKPPKTVEEILKQKKKEVGIIPAIDEVEVEDNQTPLDGDTVEKVVEADLNTETEVDKENKNPRQRVHLAKAREKALQVRKEKAEKAKFLEEYYLKNEKALAIKEKNRRLYTPKTPRQKRVPEPIPLPQQSESEEEEDEEYIHTKPEQLYHFNYQVQEQRPQEQQNFQQILAQQQKQLEYFDPKIKYDKSKPLPPLDPNRTYSMSDFF